jgi:putative aldouronate transport system permease protein
VDVHPNKTPFFKSAKNPLPLLLLALPGMAYLIINNYIPMLGIIIAFKKIDVGKGILASPWIGLSNFKFLFATPDAWIMTRNTLLYNLAFIVIGTVFAIGLAILMNEITGFFYAKYFQGMYLLPNLISMVVVSYLVFAFLNADTGLFPKSIFPALNIQDINFYTSAGYWPFILLVVFLWKNTGYGSIIYLASIAGIDKTIYEAAKIDGAGKWDQISALYSTTQTIDTYVFRGLMQLGNIGMSSAAGVYQSVIGFILVLGANFLVKKINPENALF